MRPKIHFTPEKGWMNDPNGLVYYNGEYHMFYQHDPDSVKWDTMHWGHARSRDLVHWEHLPIALFPDEQGVIYSGSAFVDKENVSGLGSKESPALLLFYTSHNNKTMREMQCLAYSIDGSSFCKYENNPIIPGKDHTPARDPQVFENHIMGGYSLCLTTGSAVEFYHSSDLICWEKTGEFVPPSYALSGMIECPCIFRDACGMYVLMLSMDVPETEFDKFPDNAIPHARTMQYFTGSFDGRKFIVSDDQKEVLLVDCGADFYAGTIFANVDVPILIAWLGDFSEGARKAPTVCEGYKGIMSYPRKLSLKPTPKGYRLCQELYPKPVEDAEIIYEKSGDEEILTDGCVIERIQNGVFQFSYTSYKDY